MYDLVTESWMDAPLPGVLPSSTIPYSTNDGRIIVMTSYGGNAISFIKSGLSVISDVHDDIVLRANPSVASFDIASTAPGHVQSYNGRMVVFFDGTFGVSSNAPNYKNATGLAFTEADIEVNNGNLDMDVIFSEHPHHGNAWPAPGCHWIHTVDTEATYLPSTFVVRDASLKVKHVFEDVCAGYHGFAMTSDLVSVAGCDTGIAGGGHFVIISYNEEADTFGMKKMSYPRDDLRPGSMWSEGNMNYAIANFGVLTPTTYNPRAAVRIDPSKDHITQDDVLMYPTIAWPEADLSGPYGVCFDGLMRGAPHHIVALLPDGQLYLYDSINLTQAAVVDVFPELRSNITRDQYSCTGSMAAKVELGRSSIIVHKVAADVMWRYNVVDNQVSNGTDLQMPTIHALTDTFIALPAPSMRDTCEAAATTTAAPGDQAGARSDGDDDNETTVTVLAVLLAIVIVMLIVLTVLFVRFTNKMANYSLIKSGGEDGSKLTAM
eukprot:TRINITY_DN7096_c0_g1_i1.p1 TRINITY_DN7096_c0_g1~~TRINITY_DN7096_c0_g1_i1.p1  ORF type:complete len:491 (+),score=115.79 TRINITY_DN7096_c0_g1_i1:296-1768(+)